MAELLSFLIFYFQFVEKVPNLKQFCNVFIYNALCRYITLIYYITLKSNDLVIKAIYLWGWIFHGDHEKS